MAVVAGPETVVLLLAVEGVPGCDVVAGPDDAVVEGAVVTGGDVVTVVPLPPPPQATVRIEAAATSARTKTNTSTIRTYLRRIMASLPTCCRNPTFTVPLLQTYRRAISLDGHEVDLYWDAPVSGYQE
jgi:hypothetical protein